METERELLAKKAVDTFMDRWMNDPSFIHLLKADPEATLRSCDIEPWDHLVESLKDVDDSVPAEELQARVSKGMTLNQWLFDPSLLSLRLVGSLVAKPPRSRTRIENG